MNDELKHLPGPILGGELLLWLWFETETRGGMFQLPDLGATGVAFDQVLEMVSVTGDGKITVRGDLPTRAAEANTALKAGKRPSLARLVIASGDDTLEVTLDASTFDLRSVKVAAEAEGDDEEDRNEGRAHLLFQLPSILDALFRQYLTLRLDDGFSKKTLAEMKRWIESRRARPASRAQEAAAS